MGDNSVASPTTSGTTLNSPQQENAASHALDTPKVIGLYGVPGSGKTILLNALKTLLGEEEYLFFDASDELAKVADELDAAHSKTRKERISMKENVLHLSSQKENADRQKAFESIADQCKKSGKIGVVTGRLSTYFQESNEYVDIWTKDNKNLFTHILYLNIDPGMLVKRREGDKERKRALLSRDEVADWQSWEKARLREKCFMSHTLCTVVHYTVEDEQKADRETRPSLRKEPDKDLANDLRRTARINIFARKVQKWMGHIRALTEEYNHSRLAPKIDPIIEKIDYNIQYVVVFDADKTIGPEDTGMLLWKAGVDAAPNKFDKAALTPMFKNEVTDGFWTFLQATFLNEEANQHGDGLFENLCTEAARRTGLYPEMLSLLQTLAEQKHIKLIIVTSAVRRIWELVLDREKLTSSIELIGGGLFKDEIVITPEIKADLVSRIKQRQKDVLVFGDSAADFEMMKKADDGILVVGDGKARSKNINKKLKIAIEKGLQIRQALLPPDAHLAAMGRSKSSSAKSTSPVNASSNL